MKNFNHKIKESNTFLWYQYSKMNAIESFDINKYKNLKKENTIYVYNEQGVLMGIINAPTEKKCIKEVKRYIAKKIFLNLWQGGNDSNFDRKAKKEEQQREWGNLKWYLKKRLKELKCFFGFHRFELDKYSICLDCGKQLTDLWHPLYKYRYFENTPDDNWLVRRNKITSKMERFFYYDNLIRWVKVEDNEGLNFLIDKFKRHGKVS